MPSFREARQQEGHPFLWLLLALLVACAVLGVIFAFVPFLVIFLVANFFFIYVAIVYLLKFWGRKTEETTSAKPGVTIIVSAFNAAKTLERALESILAMDYPKKPQVIVVDDASTDGTAAILKKFGKRIEVVTNRKNIGKAASINKALELAQGEVVACIDADTYPEKKALLKMMPHFAGRKVGAVIALVCVEKPKNFVQKIQEIEYYVSFGFWHTAMAQLDSLLVTPGPMSLYSKKALDDVGGFDEDNITEDMEIALHLQEKGYRIKCTTDAKIYTEVPDSWRALYKQRLRWLRGKIFNGRKYSHILFGSEYGDFGRFVYPVSFIVEILGVVVATRIIAMNAASAFNLTVGAAGVASIDPSLLYNAGIYSNAAVNSSVFFFIFSLVVWSYVVLLSFGLAKERIKITQMPAIIVFMTLYSALISLVYFSSMLHEAAGVQRKW
ncbi:Glycosyltransferase AglI [Candidatus Norongarragalina meridionalis]|nr:Glycosyltransferase AglI [Candidatus Norongarragalina meridionalis]